MKRIISIILCLCLLLAGCAKAPEETSVPTTAPATEATATPTTEPTIEPTAEPATEPTTVPTTEPVVLYRHPLTGEPLEEPLQTKPVGVVINNIRSAQPLHGVGAADVICEIMAEGGGSITRLLAVFSDLENAGKVGSIRSARTYLIDLARSFGYAPIVHCGYSEHAQREIAKTGYPSFNQSFYPAYFYRDQARKNAGYATEHTLFAEGEDLVLGLQENGFDLAAENGVDFGWQFAEDVALNGQTANKITCQFYSTGGKQTVMTYDAEMGVYYGTQVWKTKTEEIYDANSGESVPFKNVLMIFAKTTTNGKHMFAELTGEGTGYYACNGQVVSIKWVRADSADPFSFFLEDGTPITMGVGKTYLGVLATCSPDVIIE